MNPFEIKETVELVRLIERVKPPAQFLLDTLYPERLQTMQEYIAIEYERKQRRLAPFVTKGARGLNVSRERSRVQLYRPPMIAARRTLSIADVQERMPGEPPAYSTLTDAERAAQRQARDLVDLQNAVTNRLAAMGAELITTGKITVKAYGEDGTVVAADEIDFERPATTKNWSASTADVFGDLKDASESIQEDFGQVPTLLLCGKNFERVLLNNKVMSQFVYSANVNALAWLNVAPRYTSPQVRNLGYMASLNLAMVSYLETYTDEGALKKFIPDDVVVLCCPGQGQLLSGNVTLLEGGSWNTYAAPFVPQYISDDANQISSLTVYSRSLPLIEDVTSFAAIKFTS